MGETGVRYILTICLTFSKRLHFKSIRRKFACFTKCWGYFRSCILYIWVGFASNDFMGFAQLFILAPLLSCSFVYKWWMIHVVISKLLFCRNCTVQQSNTFSPRVHVLCGSCFPFIFGYFLSFPSHTFYLPFLRVELSCSQHLRSPDVSHKNFGNQYKSSLWNKYFYFLSRDV